MEIDITPSAAKLMQSLRYLTYTNKTAIADLVDNSFDAGASCVDIAIDKEKEITIVDNGCGMAIDTLYEAVRLGSETEKDQSCLGRFGMGLVTASISMGRRLEVVSKADGSDEINCVVLDLDDIAESRKWHASAGEVSDIDRLILEANEHGTIVHISKLDSVEGNIASEVDRHLRIVFRHFIWAGKSIYVNKQKLEATDPINRFEDDTDVLYDGDIEFNNEKVHIVVAHIDANKSDLGAKTAKAGLLAASPKHQGFYVVRNSREIAAAETLGIYTKHPSANRFRCEVSYDGALDDEFGINFTKNHLNITQGLRDKISAVVFPYIQMVKNQGDREAKVSKAENIDHKDALSVIKRKGSLLRTKTKWNEKHAKPNKKPDPVEDDDTPEDDKKKRKRVNVRNIQPGNRAMPADIIEADLGALGALFDCYFEGNKLVIRYNIRHPFHSQLIAKYSDEKNVLTPVDLLVYSLAQEQLTLEDGSDKQIALQDAIVSMSNNLRILMQ